MEYRLFLQMGIQLLSWGGATLYQLHRHDDVFYFRARVIDGLDYLLHRDTSPVIRKLGYGTESGHGVLALLCVVEADDRQVARDDPPGLVKSLEYAESHYVRCGEYCRYFRALQQRLPYVIPAAETQRADLQEAEEQL